MSKLLNGDWVLQKGVGDSLAVFKNQTSAFCLTRKTIENIKFNFKSFFTIEF